MEADASAATTGAGQADVAAPLPDWLAASSAYEPLRDRDGFLRKNVLSLAGALSVLRDAPAREGQGVAERALAGVPGSVRLAGTLVLMVCVSLARNAAFVWVMLALWMVLVASEPPRSVRALVGAPLVAAAFALLVNAPAVLLGQMAAPVRMATKSLVTVGLATHLGHALALEGTLDALRGLHLPSSALTTIDLAVRDIVCLGESATSLSEALVLRSVGKDDQKTSSAAGVMGITFLRAQRMAASRAEAMELRGYGLAGGSASGVARRGDAGGRLGAWTIAFVGVVFLLVGLFAYLEVSLA